MLGSYIARKREILSQMDPNRIYLENVRSFLGVRTKVADWLCRKACERGYFEKWIAYEHPKHGYVVYETDQLLVDENLRVVDDQALDSGDEQWEFALTELRRVDFYKALA